MEATGRPNIAKLSQTTFSEAENYEQISYIEREDGLKLIDLVAVPKGSKVLDLGCGTGFLAKVLAEFVGPEGLVVAIDPDKDRLSVAKRKYQAGNLEFLEGSANAIPGGDYDLVFSNHVLHWCKDRRAAFTNIARSLKPGGKVACSYVPSHSYNGDMLDILRNEHNQIVLSNRVSFVHEDECNVLICEHNFSELHRSQHECVHTFKDAHAYTEFFLTHFKSENIECKDFNMDAIHHRRKRDGGLYFRYPILTIIMKKN